MTDVSCTGPAMPCTMARPDPAGAAGTLDSNRTDDIIRFENILSRDIQSGETAAEPSPQSTNPAGDSGQGTIGNAIIDSMQKLSQDRIAGRERISTLFNNCTDQTMSTADIMRVQYEMLRLGVQQDLTTKTADKFSQSVQTMFRTQ